MLALHDEVIPPTAVALINKVREAGGNIGDVMVTIERLSACIICTLETMSNGMNVEGIIDAFGANVRERVHEMQEERKKRLS